MRNRDFINYEFNYIFMTESTQWIKAPENVNLYCKKCGAKMIYICKSQMCTECDRENQVESRGFCIQTFY